MNKLPFQLSKDDIVCILNLLEKDKDADEKLVSLFRTAKSLMENFEEETR